MKSRKKPLSRKRSNSNFKKGMDINKLNIRKPSRGGTRL